MSAIIVITIIITTTISNSTAVNPIAATNIVITAYTTTIGTTVVKRAIDTAVWNQRHEEGMQKSMQYVRFHNVTLLVDISRQRWSIHNAEMLLWPSNNVWFQLLRNNTSYTSCYAYAEASELPKVW